MGASFNSMKIKGTKNDVQRLFAQEQEQDRHDNGHSYSGGFGMAKGLVFSLPNMVFTSEATAINWLEENADKWGPALAVRIDAEEYVIGAWCSS